MKYLKHIIIVIVLLFIVTNIKAQNYSTLAEVISSGGGESSYSSTYSNFGVIGETFTGYPIFGGSYETSVGFLYYAEGIPVLTPEVTTESIISVFPNPANDFIIIEKGDSSIEKIEIFNIFGSIVYESEYSNRLNVSKLTKGLYFLRLIDKYGKVILIEKLLKN